MSTVSSQASEQQAQHGIGILGGTFDPVHCGHLRLALEMHGQLSLERVHLVPAAVPPHRDAPRATSEIRLALLEAATEDVDGLHIDDRELRRPGPSYTIDTLASLREEFPDRPLCLILGVDAFCGLPTWHRWEELTDFAHIAVAKRPGSRIPRQGPLTEFLSAHRTPRPKRLKEQLAGLICVREIPALDISASYVRNLLARGQSPRYLVPDSILDTLVHDGTYREADTGTSQSAEITELAVSALEELKAVDIRVLDVRSLTGVTDAMIVASGKSSRQVKALADNVVSRAKAEGHRPLGVEGERTGDWVLVDLCDVVVHVMHPDTREFYQLEKLWSADETPAGREIAP